MLPGLSGVDVCAWIRARSDVPIIVLSARMEEDLKVAALDAGADDYVTKPFGQEELLARVRAFLRRTYVSAKTSDDRIEIGELRIDLTARRVYIAEKDLHLTKTEYALLAELARQTYGDRLPETITIPALNILSRIRRWVADGPVMTRRRWFGIRPRAEVGWSVTSALPDVAGNIILYGHNNINSSIFKYLYNLKEGDEIHLTTGQADFPYVVSRVEILEVSNDDANQDAYLQYFKATRAPRLTLLSCYPPDNNTHRVIVIAYPVGSLP